MAPGLSSSAYDHMAERHRAVALSRHSREAEGLSIAQIADTSSLADPGRNRRDRHRLDRAEDDRPQQSINPPIPRRAA
jgi:hypothetical protein